MASMEETSRLYREGKINYPQWLGRNLWGGVAQPLLSKVADIPWLGDELAAIGNAYERMGLPTLTWGGDPQYEPDFEATMGLLSLGLAPLKGTQAANRGMTTTSGNVHVYNNYNPRELKYGSGLEKKLNELEETNPEAALGARKALGFGQWGIEGLFNAGRMAFSPTARAKYAELGINPYVFEKNMRKIDDAKADLKKAEATGDEEGILRARRDISEGKKWAHQQLQATANIRQQAQAKARGYELTDDAMENAVDAAATLRAGSKFWTPKGDSWYNEIIAPSRANAGVKTYDRWNDRDSSTVQSHIEREIAKAGGTPEGTKIVVKNSNKISGAHHYDLFNQNKVANGIARAFKSNFLDSKKRQFKNSQELHEYLSDPKHQFDENGNRRYYVKFDGATRIDEDGGVWITGSNTGSGKVEGATNVLYKVYPDGRMMGMMTDVHDWMENVPVLGKALDKALPTKVVAVTPPLHGDIWDNLITKKNRAKNRKRLDSGVQRMETPQGFDYIGELLDDIRGQQPSMNALLRQYGEVGLNTLPVLQAASGGTLFSNEEQQ